MEVNHYQHRDGGIFSRKQVLQGLGTRDDQGYVTYSDYATSLSDYPNQFIEDDEELVMEAVAQNGEVLREASQRLKDNDTVVLAAVDNYGSAFEFASKRLRADRHFVLRAVEVNAEAFQHASESLRNDRAVIIAAIRSKRKDLWLLRHVSPDNPILDDRELVLEAVSVDGMNLEFVSPRLRDDKEVVLAAVAQFCEDTTEYASSRLQVDREVALAAVESHGTALRYLSSQLKGDRHVVMTAIQNEGAAILFASEDLQGDRSLVMEALKSSDRGDATGVHWLDHYTRFNHALANDPDIAAFAVRLGCCPGLLPPTAIANRNVALAAVRYSGFHIYHLPSELRSDKEIALAALHTGDSGQVSDVNDPVIFRQISADLRDDPEIVARAIENQIDLPLYGGVIWKYCGETIKKDLCTLASFYCGWRKYCSSNMHATTIQQDITTTFTGFFSSLRSDAWQKVWCLQSSFPDAVRKNIIQYLDICDCLRAANIAERLKLVISATAKYKGISELELLANWDRNNPFSSSSPDRIDDVFEPSYEEEDVVLEDFIREELDGGESIPRSGIFDDSDSSSVEFEYDTGGSAIKTWSSRFEDDEEEECCPPIDKIAERRKKRIAIDAGESDEDTDEAAPRPPSTQPQEEQRCGRKRMNWFVGSDDESDIDNAAVSTRRPKRG